MNISMGMRMLSSKKITKNEFDRIIEEHRKWLENNETGKRADLSDLDLSETDLSGMDLSYADLEGTNLMKANLAGADLSNAYLRSAALHGADLSRARLDNTDFSGADLTAATFDSCKGIKTKFFGACMWDCSFRKADLREAAFYFAEICDSDFTGAGLEEAVFSGADFDNAVFVETDLKNADLMFAKRVFWSDFANADMTGTIVSGARLNPKMLKGVKGLKIPMCCPEEGSFVAWKMCAEGKTVKLLIPEHAQRKGSTPYSCHASEAVVLDIFDKDGNPADQAVSQTDETVVYRKGKTVFPKAVDPETYGDVTGIYFVLSRADTERYLEDGEDDEEETEET